MSRPDHLIPIERIVELLAARAAELARELLPLGRREGPEWREASTRQGGMGDSLSVHLLGDRAGVFFHGGAGRSGDALDLIAYLATNGNKTDAIKWARGWLGLDGTNPAALTRTREAQVEREKALEREEEDAEQRRRAAKAIFLAGSEKLIGTPVEGYLRGRGLPIGALPYPVRSLRFHPELFHKSSNRKWPAMVAAIVDQAGQIMAVHRTWLYVRPDGSVMKAPVENAKMTLGSFRGGVIRLWRGTRVDPKTGEIKQGRPINDRTEPFDVDITEGIEDGLTVALAVEEATVLVGVSLGNMLSIRLPTGASTVNLWQQNDAAGSQAAGLFDRVIGHFQQEGRRVCLCRAPEGIKDVNDVVRAGLPVESAVGA